MPWPTTLLKVIVSAVAIEVVSEVAKVSAGLGALIESLPLVAILAMVWLYVDTRDKGASRLCPSVRFGWSCRRSRCSWCCHGCSATGGNSTER